MGDTRTIGGKRYQVDKVFWGDGAKRKARKYADKLRASKRYKSVRIKVEESPRGRVYFVCVR